MPIDNPAAGNVQRNLLLVDDEESILSSLRRMLRKEGYRIFTAASAREGLDILGREPIGVIISDQRMPGMTGTEFFNIVKERFPDTVRLVLSGYTELNSIADAINQGAIYKFLTKPWDDDLLRGHIAEAFQRFEMKRENQRLAEINRALVDAVRDILLMVDPITLRIVFANRGAAELLGYRREALTGMAITEIETLPQDAFYWEEMVHAPFRALANVETGYRTASGRLIPVGKTTANARHEGLNNIVVIARDLAGQHLAEQQLAQANARLAAIFEATTEGMLVIDKEGGLSGMNRRLAQLWPQAGHSLARDGGEFLAALAKVCQEPSVIAARFAAALADPGRRHEGWLRTGDGRQVFWASNPQEILGTVVGQVFSFLEPSTLPDAAA